ncbi:alpha/beta hydrolase [Arthrobacter echini]|uniref:Alpha/beta hydrolase n=1 Tax=Arthrobacter echini TaxID=1529066 RepID=A0A4S5E649_9MICC|nr:alpha/beta hydrolase [Arthrobacter echini]THJ66932.1 alpha/beta hydrolase [Arthrobacter echini]
MDAQQLMVTAPDQAQLAVTRWPAPGPVIVFLHAGVADRRSWTLVADTLRGESLDLLAYDRRGYGDTPAAAPSSSFTHVDDLIHILDDLDLQKVLLVGNSMGGAVAIDTALLHPDRVSGLVLLGAGVSGMTDDDTAFDWEPDDASAPLLARADDAEATADDRIRALAHLWLDGPEAPEGRVSGSARDLFVEMNRRILAVGAPDSAGDAGVDAWTRLDEVSVPVLCTWGELDLPCDIPFYEETARRIGQEPGRVLPAVAHLPGLEQPALIAELVRNAARP